MGFCSTTVEIAIEMLKQAFFQKKYGFIRSILSSICHRGFRNLLELYVITLTL